MGKLIGISVCFVCYFLFMLLIRFNQFADDDAASLQIRRYLRRDNLPLLCLLWRWMAGYSLALQHRDHPPAHAHDRYISECRRAVGDRLYGCSSYPQRDPEPAVAVLSDLGVFNFFSIPIIYLFYPETASRRLEDINLVFGEGLRTWVFLNKEATQLQRPARFVAMDEYGVERARAEVKNGLGAQVEQIE
ncbi:hypothetical protein BDV12DRAFT_105423 [Aspergillus spectabilis]